MASGVTRRDRYQELVMSKLHVRKRFKEEEIVDLPKIENDLVTGRYC